MNTRQENTFSMYYVFIKYINNRRDIADVLPFFKEIFEKFASTVVDIEALRTIQEGDKSGHTLNKNALRMQLEIEVHQLSKKLVAWGSLKSDQALLKEITYTPSDLAKANDTGIKSLASNVLKFGKVHIGDLASFGATEATLTSLESTMRKYSASIAEPKESLNERSAATLQIEALFEVAEEQLHLMTKIVDAVSEIHVEFYEGFHKAIKVVNLGAKGLSLRASAMDLEGNPISNVSVAIVSQRSANARLEAGSTSKLTPMLTKKTTDKGIFRIQNLPDGYYTAIVKKTGFKDQEVNFHVAKGEMVDLNLTLENA